MCKYTAWPINATKVVSLKMEKNLKNVFQELLSVKGTNSKMVLDNTECPKKAVQKNIYYFKCNTLYIFKF